VELFEQYAVRWSFGVGTIAGVSRKLGVHRRMVREALHSAEPAASKPQRRRLRKLVDASAFIDRVLTEDRQAPVKQRHTARRIWQRLCAELPVSREASARSAAMSTARGDCWDSAGPPTRYSFRRATTGGGSAGGLVRVVCRSRWRAHQAAGLRDAFDGQRGSFSPAYTHATQQAFLEAHELAFRYFGGVFRLLRYDNLSSAVKKILHGHRREETSRFIAFRSHWRYRVSSVIRLVATKGGVEGEGATSAATTGCLCQKLAASMS